MNFQKFIFLSLICSGFIIIYCVLFVYAFISCLNHKIIYIIQRYIYSRVINLNICSQLKLMEVTMQIGLDIGSTTIKIAVLDDT